MTTNLDASTFNTLTLLTTTPCDRRIPPPAMAEPLPPALKIPEISRFINRANQLRAIKPAIAYWCMCPPPVRDGGGPRSCSCFALQIDMRWMLEGEPCG